MSDLRRRNPIRGLTRPALRLESLEERAVPSTVTVGSSSDDGANTLRAALGNAAVDSILIDASLSGQTLSLVHGELPIAHPVAIRNLGTGHLTIDGRNAARVFEVSPGVTASLAGLTITGGLVTSATVARGGGILNAGTLTLTDCTVVGNRVTVTAPGGATDQALAQGAGISSSGTLSLVDCTVTGNTASVASGVDYSNANGGGLYDDGGILILNHCTVSGNTVMASGAGLCFGYGGGVTADNGTLMLTGCTVSGNTASGGNGDGDGAGVHSYQGSVTLTNCTIAGNTATAAAGSGIGGGTSDLDSSLTLTNCTVTVNRAASALGTGTGGGISHTGMGTALLFNTIVAGNTAPTTGPDASGTLASLGTNLIGKTDGGTGWLGTDLTGTIAHPLDARLEPLANNGGPTQTVALLAGSPALNAGDPAQLGTPDQRGVVRGGGVNVGAYQATADHFDLSAPAAVTAGAAFAVTAVARDPFGKTAVGYVGTVYLVSTDPLVPGLDADTYTLADGGTHSFVGEALYTAGPQTLFAGDWQIDGGLALTVTPGAAVQLVLSSFGTMQAGVAFTVTVTAYDAYGNVATGYLGTVHFDSTDPAAALPPDYPFQPSDQGSASFSIALNTSGPVHLTVTDTTDGTLTSFLDVTVP